MYSLIDEPWIMVVTTEGERKMASLCQLFSGEIRAAYLQGDSAPQNYAVLRLLLAIFWRAHSPEAKVQAGRTFSYARWFEKTRRTLSEKACDEIALEYLERYRDRFDLLDTETPFMQVADLNTAKGEVKGIETIVPEIQQDYFTMRAGSTKGSLSIPEAARWLVYVQAFDYSGIKSGAVGDRRVKGGKGYPIGVGWSGMTGGTVVTGENLFETLIFNTTPMCLGSLDDRPVWERSPDGPGPRETVGEKSEPQGPADLATWQSRRVRLVPERDKIVAVVLSNGDKIPEAGANVFGDPMTPYRFSSNKSKKNHDVYYPRPYDPLRTMWRSLEALVVAEGDEGFSAREKAPKRPATLTNLAALADEVDGIPELLNIELVSVEYGSQSSSVANIFSASVGMPVVLLLQNSRYLRRTVREITGSTSECAIFLGQYAGQILAAAGGDYAFRPVVTDELLAELEEPFLQWLTKLAELPTSECLDQNPKIRNARASWEATVRSAVEERARILLRGAGPKALSGRMVINGEGARPGIVSAGTYYRNLLKKLDKELSMTVKVNVSRKESGDGKFKTR
ncbi:type I-E CRISPR-associated protein Cse1/CasA [Corynebacterium uterequi]|uniref:CRISPR type I-E/ECOLI-associated protein CasA/Cse1 n=1 Tax=Corynebacterium uterequi TaxID=1072256 RepID=A0A0G3HIH3_9CORY|nr:type I-E CRISPR-associated protein Cse1/CasA [Corynebacterium uterequi]AKK11723.1 CRISPR type I-E/ECOLI-associated protein CasA/Cse1 [Corynebacterium uterequi]